MYERAKHVPPEPLLRAWRRLTKVDLDEVGHVEQRWVSEWVLRRMGTRATTKIVKYVSIHVLWPNRAGIQKYEHLCAAWCPCSYCAGRHIRWLLRCVAHVETSSRPVLRVQSHPEAENVSGSSLDSRTSSRVHRREACIASVEQQ